MTRFLFALALAPAASSPAFAQDMPLSQILIDGRGWKEVDPAGEQPPRIGPPTTPGNRRLAEVTYSQDRGTLFVAAPGERFLLAAPARVDGSAASAAVPYAPLRVKRGERTIAVTALAADRDGRIYAATEIGVQVFDPTGRLCGVLAPAAPGKPEHLAFEGDELTLWIGDTKYARKLNTQGATSVRR